MKVEWHRVEDRLPESGQTVYVVVAFRINKGGVHDYREPDLGHYYQQTWYYQTGDEIGKARPNVRVTHWAEYESPEWPDLPEAAS